MFNNLNETITFFTLAAVPFLFAITIHEVSHAYAAYILGDNTAKDMGRLTLNPFAHIDPLGLMVLLLTRMFGWAKPVPINYATVSRKKYGLLIVAAAGPLANIAMSLISAFLLYILIVLEPKFPGAYKLIHPLQLSAYLSININLVLAFFNIIPIPPLDGSKILADLLPRDAAMRYLHFQRYSFIILIVLIYIGAFNTYIRYTAGFCMDLIMKILGVIT